MHIGRFSGDGLKNSPGSSWHESAPFVWKKYRNEKKYSPSPFCVFAGASRRAAPVRAAAFVCSATLACLLQKYKGVVGMTEGDEARDETGNSLYSDPFCPRPAGKFTEVPWDGDQRVELE